MANLMDYLDWRGDVPLSSCPFNEVDNLILSEVAYVDFGGIVPNPEAGGSIPLFEASKRFFERHTQEQLDAEISITKKSITVLKKAAACPRFQFIRLSCYVDQIDLDGQKQFSALHMGLDDGTTYIAFRGTDNTMVGWKEDFNMTFRETVPSQLEAQNYLDKTISFRERKLRVGGHSKGGNLAVFASVRCRPSIARRIIEVYNNDGPGFSGEILHSEEYHRMLPRIRTIVPQSSVVGMLLEHEEEYVVVKSSTIGLMQHDALTWEVLGPSFVTAENVTKESKLLDLTLKTWLGKMTPTERERYIDTLYELLVSSDIKEVKDLASFKKTGALLKAVGDLDRADKEMLLKTLGLLLSASTKVLKEREHLAGEGQTRLLRRS